jgi:hypothetical protein
MSECRKAERSEVPNACSGSHPVPVIMPVCVNAFVMGISYKVSKISSKINFKMIKIKIYTTLMTGFLLSLSILNYAQVPDLKTTADFILFTSSGGITNTGVSQILGGAIGTDFGALTGFDDVNVVKHIANDVTAQCKLDLQAVYDEISAIVPTATITAANLNGGTITQGIYQINEAVALTIDLTLDAQDNPDALFIFKVTGAIDAAASVNVVLTNGASVNNIFWHGTAAIGAGAGASLKGTYMTNAGAISLGAGASLEGRALTVIGEVTMSGSTLTGCIMPEATTVTLTQPSCSVPTGTIEITAPLGAEMTYSIDGVDFTNTTGLFTQVPAGDYTVTSKNTDGCISMTYITLTGFRHPPTLGTVTDFVLFTTAGEMGNTGTSSITGGAIGTHAGAITGFDPSVVQHIANDETLQCKADLQAAFDEIAAIPTTETIIAADLSGTILTAGVYHINSAANLTIDLTLDAQGDTEAIFIFKVTGAFSVAASVHIILINGASVNNVFWNVDGALSAGAGATMRGTFFALAGEISLGDGSKLEGRALTIAGAVNTNNSVVTVCIKPARPVVTLTQPNCSQAKGSIAIISPTADGMTYRIDYCAYTNTTGVFTDILAGTYLVTAKGSDGCISDGETVIINEDSSPITWTGSESNAWHNTGTWDLDEIPGPHCDVVIPDNGIVNINSDTPAVSKGLSIGTGAVLTIEAGNTLTVNESLANNAGVSGLVIKDGGSLMHNTPNVPATIERLFDTAEAWRLVSSPVSGQSINNGWTPSGTYAGGHGYDFYAYDEATATWLNQKVGPNSITQFLSATGYLVSFQTPGQTKAFAGNLHAGDMTIGVSNSVGDNYAGCNLIGNPYASGIDWNIANRSLFIDDFAYLYDRVSSEEGVTEGYKTVDGSKTDAWIAPNQGFFVIKETPGTASFSFTNAIRGHGGVITKGTPADEVLELQLGNDSYYDQATLRIRDNASFARDRSDAMKFYSLNDNMPQLYSYTSDQVKVAINSIPAIDQEKVITLGVRIPADGSYTLSVSEISGRFQSSPLYLRNNMTGEIHNLRENPPYSFTATKGDEPTQFDIWFTQPTDVSQQPAENLIHFYTHGQNLYITFGKDAPGRTLEVIDIIGRKLIHRSLGIGLQLTEQLNLQTGVYIVRIIDRGEVKTKRIFIE